VCDPKNQTACRVIGGRSGLYGLGQRTDARRCLRLMYACGLPADRRDPAAGLRHRRATDAGAGPPGHRGQERGVVPLAPRVLALLREYWGASGPPLGVSPGRSAPLSPTSLQQTSSGGAPEWHPQRGSSIRGGTPMRPICWTRGVAASHAGTAGHQSPIPRARYTLSRLRPWISCMPPSRPHGDR